MMGFIKILLLSLVIGLVSCNNSNSCKEYSFHDHVKVITGFYKGQRGIINKMYYSINTCSRQYVVTFDSSGVYDRFLSEEIEID